MITVTARPQSTRLTTLGRVKADLGITDDLQDQALLARIDAASQAVVDACRRPFAREVLTETLPGDSGTTLQLARTPVVAVSAVLLDATAVTDYTIEDAEAGWLYRDDGWEWTAQPRQFIAPYFQPGTERPAFSVSYTAGYLLPDDDRAEPMSAAAVDKSFNLASGAFPLLAAGDRITTSGFAQAVNNGAWTVVTRTALKVTVAEAGIVDAAADADRAVSLACRTLPATLEQGCLAVVRALHYQRTRDPAVASKSVGGLSIAFRSPEYRAGSVVTTLPAEAIMLIRSYIRKC